MEFGLHRCKVCGIYAGALTNVDVGCVVVIHGH